MNVNLHRFRGIDGTPLSLHDKVRCVINDPEITDVEGEIIKFSRNGFFVYVKLDKKLLPNSDAPEILVTPPVLWKKL